MSRDPSGIYTVPAGTDGIPDTTIESAKYNGFVHDVEQDLNTARPIVAGGTGATSASAARDNLDAEVAMQTVTNYDSHVWETGSFKSAPGATNSPDGAGGATNYYVGVMQVLDSSAAVVEASNFTTGAKYVRKKLANVWGAWTSSTAISENFTISKTTPIITLNETSGSGLNAIIGKKLNVERWAILLGDGQTETGSNTGSNFSVQAFSDAGSPLSLPITIIRASGQVRMPGGVLVSAPSPQLILDKGASGASNQFTGSTGGVARWVMAMGNSVAEGGGNAGSNFELAAYNDAGVYLASPINIDRATCAVTLSHGLFVGPGPYGPYATATHITYQGGAGQFGMAFRPLANDTYAILFHATDGAVAGNIYTTATTTAYNTTSDARLKEDLKTFDAGRIVDDTNVYDFAWKATGERAYGVIAQETFDVYPAAVTHDEKTDTWSVDYSKYVPVLLQELKALRARIATLEGQLGTAVQPA